MASFVPFALNASEATLVANVGREDIFFLATPSHSETTPSAPPVAKVPWTGWNANVFSG